MYNIPLTNATNATISRAKDGSKILSTRPADKLRVPKWDTMTDKLPANTPTAIHLGKNGLIAIDFDSELFNTALELNASLPEDQQCQYVAKSIGKEGGHLLYKYSDTQLTEFIGNPNGKKQNKLDTLYGETLLFHHQNNETKKLLTDQQEITNTVPLAIQLLVINHYITTAPLPTLHQKPVHSDHSGSKLAYIVQNALQNNTLALSSLMRIVTPREYRSQIENSHKPLPPYHPDRLPETESGHMYMVPISMIFKQDPSIDKELHANIMDHINAQFTHPLPQSQLDSIVKRDINAADFNYDPEWKNRSLLVTTKSQHLLEVFMYTEARKIRYLVYDHMTKISVEYDTASAVLKLISNTTRRPMRTDQLDQNSIHVNIINDPDLPHGYLPDPDYPAFNKYNWTPEQVAFYRPADYKSTWTAHDQKLDYNPDHPHYPTTTLAALEHSVGGLLYTHFLPFLNRKYSTRDHSPLFFVLYGVPGSFKSAITEGILSKLSHQRYLKISENVLTDKYNDWMIDVDLIFLDEISEMDPMLRKPMIGTVKKITGSEIISGVRPMYQSISKDTFKQQITIFMATNHPTQLILEPQDRRMVVFQAHTTISEALNMTEQDIKAKVKSETVDFAYYLATQVDALSGNDYQTNRNWKTKDYHEYIEHSMSYEDRIRKYIINDDIDSLLSLCYDLGMDDELIAKSIYEYKGRTTIRMVNSREDIATKPALLTQLPLTITKPLKDYTGILHAKGQTKDGYTNNKKSEYYPTVLPERLLDLVNDEKVVAIEPEL